MKINEIIENKIFVDSVGQIINENSIMEVNGKAIIRN